MSIVGLDKHGKVQAFAAFASSPPALEAETDNDSFRDIDSQEEMSEYSTLADWTAWITSNWQADNFHSHNSKFLTYFVSSNQDGPAYLDSILSSAFLAMQKTTSIAYFLPDAYPLYAPLSLSKFNGSVDAPKPAALAVAEGKIPKEKQTSPESGDKRRPLQQRKPSFIKEHHDETYFSLLEKADTTSLGFNMYVCARAQVLPRFHVRKARVEDTDDLAPMLRKQRVCLCCLWRGSYSGMKKTTFSCQICCSIGTTTQRPSLRKSTPRWLGL
jgi:hypothetical protein